MQPTLDRGLQAEDARHSRAPSFRNQRWRSQDVVDMVDHRGSCRVLERALDASWGKDSQQCHLRVVLADDGPGFNSSPATLVALFDHSERYFNRGRRCQSQRSPPNMKNHPKLCRSPPRNKLCIPRINYLSFIGLYAHYLLDRIGDPLIPILAQLPWDFGLEWDYPRVSFHLISCISELQPSRLSKLRFQYAIRLIIPSYHAAVVMTLSMMTLSSTFHGQITVVRLHRSPPLGLSGISCFPAPQ